MAGRMMQQAVRSAQVRLEQLQKAYDEAFIAWETDPSSGLKRERYEELKVSLHKAEDAVNSLAAAAIASAECYLACISCDKKVCIQVNRRFLGQRNLQASCAHFAASQPVCNAAFQLVMWRNRINTGTETCLCVLRNCS